MILLYCAQKWQKPLGSCCFALGFRKLWNLLETVHDVDDGGGAGKSVETLSPP